MNALMTAAVASVLAARSAAVPAATAAPAPIVQGATPAVVTAAVNPSTTLLLTPSTGGLVLAIDAPGTDYVLVPGRSPVLLRTDPNARPAGDVQLLTGSR